MPVKKTFANKRFSLGVSRNYHTKSGKIEGEANRKIRNVKESIQNRKSDLVDKNKITIKKINTKLEVLKLKVPKDRLEKKQIAEEIKKLNDRLIEINNSKIESNAQLSRLQKLKIEDVNYKRNVERLKRQNNILFNQIFAIAFPKADKISRGLNKTSISSAYLRKVYLEYTKNNNKSFQDITQREAKSLLKLAHSLTKASKNI